METCPRCGRELDGLPSPCPECGGVGGSVMLDPGWTPAAGYGHAAALMSGPVAKPDLDGYSGFLR